MTTTAVGAAETNTASLVPQTMGASSLYAHASTSTGVMPPELWHGISRTLMEQGDGETLGSLCLASRALCRIAFPFSQVVAARSLERLEGEALPHKFDHVLNYFAPVPQPSPQQVADRNAPGSAGSGSPSIPQQCRPGNMQLAWGVAALGGGLSKLLLDESSGIRGRQWSRFQRLLTVAKPLACQGAESALRSVGTSACGLATDADHAVAISLIVIAARARSSGGGHLLAGALASLRHLTGGQLERHWQPLLKESLNHAPEERAVALAEFAACLPQLPESMMKKCGEDLIAEIERLQPEALRIRPLHQLGEHIVEVLDQSEDVGVKLYDQVLRACDRLRPHGRWQALKGLATAYPALPPPQVIPQNSPIGHGGSCDHRTAVTNSHDACVALLQRTGGFDDEGKAACLAAMGHAMSLLASDDLHDALFFELLLRSEGLDASHRYVPVLVLAHAIDGLTDAVVLVVAKRLLDTAQEMPTPWQVGDVRQALQRAAERIGHDLGADLLALLEDGPPSGGTAVEGPPGTGIAQPRITSPGDPA